MRYTSLLIDTGREVQIQHVVCEAVATQRSAVSALRLDFGELDRDGAQPSAICGHMSLLVSYSSVADIRRTTSASDIVPLYLHCQMPHDMYWASRPQIAF